MTASDVFAVTIIGLIVVTVTVSVFSDDDIETRFQIIQENGDAERAIERLLDDPRSARFRHRGNGCGTVNARGDSGSYTGFRRFIANADAIAIGNGITGQTEFERLWRQHCDPANP